jgi:hypothetical protein
MDVSPWFVGSNSLFVQFSGEHNAVVPAPPPAGLFDYLLELVFL